MRRLMRVSVGIMLCVLGSVASGHGYEVVTVTDGGTLTGTVQLRGARPAREVLEISKDQSVCGKTEKVNETLIVGEQLGIQNAVVSLTNIKRGKAISSKGVTIDQRECRYTPHVVLIPLGGDLTILNSDGILHNIRTHSSKNPSINKAHPKFKKVIKERFQFPEVIKLTCDAHAWMTGWLVVMEHPYSVLTDAHGQFRIEHIPPGDYAVTVWHESLPQQMQQIKIQANSTTTMAVKMSVP